MRENPVKTGCLNPVLLLLAYGFLLLFSGCNADPKKIGKRVSPAREKKSIFSEFANRMKAPRSRLFAATSSSVTTRVLLVPGDISLFSSRRVDVGVLLQQGESARETLRMLELSKSVAPVDCGTDWQLHVFDNEKVSMVEIQWECRSIRMDSETYELKPGARKHLGNLITTARLHPTHRATVLKVPVVHDPEDVRELVGAFVQEVLPLDVRLYRYPSFVVSTEHFESMTRDFTEMDDQVLRLRTRLRDRLTTFANTIRARGKDTIVEILEPVPMQERFSRELFARWGMTVLCALGTGTDRMYWLASGKRFGISHLEVPTHYPMVVVQFPASDSRPALAAQLAAMHLDPPLIWP